MSDDEALTFGHFDRVMATTVEGVSAISQRVARGTVTMTRATLSVLDEESVGSDEGVALALSLSLVLEQVQESPTDQDSKWLDTAMDLVLALQDEEAAGTLRLPLATGVFAACSHLLGKVDGDRLGRLSLALSAVADGAVDALSPLSTSLVHSLQRTVAGKDGLSVRYSLSHTGLLPGERELGQLEGGSTEWLLHLTLRAQASLARAVADSSEPLSRSLSPALVEPAAAMSLPLSSLPRNLISFLTVCGVLQPKWHATDAAEPLEAERVRAIGVLRDLLTRAVREMEHAIVARTEADKAGKEWTPVDSTGLVSFVPLCLVVLARLAKDPRDGPTEQALLPLSLTARLINPTSFAYLSYALATSLAACYVSALDILLSWCYGTGPLYLSLVTAALSVAWSGRQPLSLSSSLTRLLNRMSRAKFVQGIVPHLPAAVAAWAVLAASDPPTGQPVLVDDDSERPATREDHLAAAADALSLLAHLATPQGISTAMSLSLSTAAIEVIRGWAGRKRKTLRSIMR